MTLEVQFATVLAMIGCGVGLGAWLDVYRLIARRCGARRPVVAILDLVLWAAAAPPVFAVLYAVNAGEFRMYVLLALGVGWCLYFGLFGGVVRRGVTAAFRVASALARTVGLRRPRRTG